GGAVFSSGPRSHETGQRAPEGREFSAGKLARPVAIAQLKAHDARVRILGGQTVRQRQYAIEKARGESHVGIEQEKPLAPAEAAAFIDRTGKTAVAAPAAQGDARTAAETSGQAMRGRMVVHDDDLGRPPPRAWSVGQLMDQGRRVFPLP